MSMQQPVPPEQNVTPEVAQAEQVTDVNTAPPAQDLQPVPADGQVPPEQMSAQQEAQVIDTIATGLEEEEITAADIMTAVLSDSLGISPRGAQSLFQLLMSEFESDVAEIEQPNNEPPVV